MRLKTLQILIDEKGVLSLQIMFTKIVLAYQKDKIIN